MEIIAKRLRARLDHLGLNQTEVVRRTGLHRDTLRKLLDGGARVLPHPDRLIALCELIGLMPGQLLGLEPAPDQPETRPRSPRAARVEALLGGLADLDESRLLPVAELIDLLHEHRAVLAVSPNIGTPTGAQDGGSAAG